jgi:hypothetical protein
MKCICVLLAGCLLCAACGAPLTPIASAIEDVPVPRAARQNGVRFLAATGSATEKALLAADRQAAYRVPGMSREDLLSWYDEQLPMGEPWQEWRWCGRLSQLFQRTYYQPGTDRMLALMVQSGGVLILQADTGLPLAAC